MKQVTLPNNMKMEYNDLPYYYTDEWISNGSFIIKRERIKDSFKYCLHKPNFTQPDIARVVQPYPEHTIKITKSDFLYDMGKEFARIFADEQGNEYFVAEKYVKQFGIEELYTDGQERNILISSDLSLLLMPMNKPKKLQKVA